MADLIDAGKKSFIYKIVAALNENKPDLAAANQREISLAKHLFFPAEFAKQRKV